MQEWLPTLPNLRARIPHGRRAGIRRWLGSRRRDNGQGRLDTLPLAPVIAPERAGTNSKGGPKWVNAKGINAMPDGSKSYKDREVGDCPITRRIVFSLCAGIAEDPYRKSMTPWPQNTEKTSWMDAALASRPTYRIELAAPAHRQVN